MKLYSNKNLMKKNYFDNLDGLRFIAFLGIFIQHGINLKNLDLTSGINQFINILIKPAYLGVPFFFCMSGFLITYLILIEYKKHSKINIKNFYIRRILRIWPLYYFVVIFGFFVFPYIREVFLNQPNVENASLIKYLLFLSNFDQIEKGLPFGIGLGPTWSLSVEEQFYLVWPIILTLTPRKFYIAILFVILLISQMSMFYVDSTHTLFCMTDLALGGILAVASFDEYKIFESLKKLSKSMIFLIYVLGISSCYIFVTYKIGGQLVSLFMLFVIFEQCFAENSIVKMGTFKKMSYLGTLSYSFYLLHSIAIFIMYSISSKILHIEPSFLNNIIFMPVCSFILTLIFGYFSYNYFEKPFLNLKDKFSMV